MKTLIFSDTHLTGRFERRRYRFLRRIISRADKVIINGDFWDDCVDNHKFMRSGWRQLFPLLKSKDTIYIHGNHDMIGKWSEDPRIFCKKSCHEYRFRSGKKKFLVTHGHTLLHGSTSKEIISKQKNLLARSVWRFALFFPEHMRWFIVSLRLERLLVLLTRGRVYKRFRFLNERMRDNAGELGKDEILICGHSHVQEINLEKNYVNTGFVNHGIGQFIVIEKGDIRMMDERD